MKIILVSGNCHDIMVPYIKEKWEIINNKSLKLEETIDYIADFDNYIDCILLTDHAFSDSTESDKAKILLLLQWSKEKSCPLMILSNDLLRVNQLKSLLNDDNFVFYIFFDWLRPSAGIIKLVYEELAKISKSNSKKKIGKDNDVLKKRKSFLGFIKNPQPSNSIKQKDHLTREFENLGISISRVIAITGHRGSGVSSTAINLAYEASRRGLNTIIVDLDIEFRSFNMYFDGFHKMTQKDDVINASLIRTLARPQDYKTTAFNVSNNLWLISLGYSFSDKKLIDQFYNNSKLIGLISVLRC